ncbi:MAG: single-stranded-DNA-specific exonuclease RecJ [Pseudomonadota bacterium]
MSDAAKTYFLNVKESANGQVWIDRLKTGDRNTAQAISQSMDVPELLGRVMAARGVKADEAAAYLNPALRDLMPDPSTLTDMDKAINRACDAITANQRIAIFGDYDVDGACSSAQLARYFMQTGIENEIYIPDRIFEGYGPNPEAIAKLVERGAQLIITVDCGATSFEALEEAKSLGVDVIVLDHHQMGVELPHCEALVNPNRQDDLSGLGHLCAAGVVFMFLAGLNRKLRETQNNNRGNLPDLMALLDLVAFATVCDVVPLIGLNRAFVVKGLQVMAQQKNAGLKALMRAGRLDGPPRPYHLGFVLGPRVNAGGRIGDAALGARLLSIDDDTQAEEIAAQLEELNRQRQLAEKQMLEVATAEAEAEMQAAKPPAVLLTASDDWHPGIVGLLASRLKDKFHRPSFAIAFDRNGKGSGSGRSIHGVDLGGVVRAAVSEGLLDKGGGHAMAAGLTVNKDNLGALRAFFEDKLSDAVLSANETRSLKIDGALSARSATLELYELLERAGPFGSGNSQPVFCLPAHSIRYAKIVGTDHVSFSAQSGDGANVRAIAFRAADTPVGKLLLDSNQPIHLAGTLNADFWQGSKRVQFRLLDAVVAR